MFPNKNIEDCPLLRQHHRLILKSGHCNINQSVSNRQKMMFLRYSKLVDYSWSFTLAIFLAVLSTSWMVFAIFYWLICFTHGDFEADHLPEFQKINNFKPCIYDMRDFSSALLFSMEAQHTVGYGVKAPSDECAEAIFVNSVHCIIGFIMQGFMAAVIFSKMTKPRSRSQTIMFSKNAVISRKNGQLSFMFRIGDMRPKHLMEAHVRIFLVETLKTAEGQTLPYTQTELHVQMDDCSNNIFFNWPVIMYHVIDEGSPLSGLSMGNLHKQRFEIVTVIEGTDEYTGQRTQARSSYTPNEILWGFQFQSLFSFDKLREEYAVDFSKFDAVVPVQFLHYSAIQKN